MYIYERNYFFNSIVKKTEEELEELICHKMSYYDFYSIPKKNGYRDICAIKKATSFYGVQTDLKKYFYKLPISNVAKGFKTGESYFDFLKPHLNKIYYLRLDIKDFFGSISSTQIADALAPYCRFEDICTYMVELCTLDEKLPQGAVTSPVLSNIIFTRVDQRILKYCQSLLTVYREGEQQINDVVYTRYADDLLFSSNYLDFKKDKYFIRIIKKILKENGFEINYEKIKYGFKQISLSGFVIGDDIHLSRKKVNELNTILYYFDRRGNVLNKKYRIDNNKISDTELIKNLKLAIAGSKGSHVADFNTISDLVNYLCGYRAFLISVVQVNDNMNKSMTQIYKKIKKLEELIDALAKKWKE